MKKVLIFIATFLSFHIFAQYTDVNISSSPVLKSNRAEEREIIGYTGNSIFTLELYGTFATPYDPLGTNNVFYFKKFNRNNFKLEYDIKINDFIYKDEEGYFEKSWVQNGIVHIFFTLSHKKLGKAFLLHQTIDKNGQISEPTEIFSMKIRNNDSYSYFDITCSEDSSLILIMAHQGLKKKSDNIIAIKVLNKNYQLQWEKNLTNQFIKQKIQLVSQAISNSGDVFMIGNKESENITGKDYIFFRISKDEVKKGGYDSNLANSFIHSAVLFCDLDNNLITITGFYSDEEKQAIGGTFFTTFDQQDLQIKLSRKEPIDAEPMKKYYGDDKKLTDLNLEDFVLSDFIQNEDGGVVLVAEVKYDYIDSRRYTFFNDLLIVRMNSEGSVVQTSHIPKLYNTVKGWYSSFLLIPENNNLHFIFNDDEDNTERLEKGKRIHMLGSLYASVTLIVTIDPDGNISRKTIIENKDEETWFSPRGSMRTSKGEGILLKMSNLRVQFINLNFK